MNIQEHAAHMCHMITTNYPQQMASDLRLIAIHSRFADIVEDPVYYSGVHGERAFDAACNDFVDWEEFFEIVEREREVLRSRRQ